MDLSKQIEPSFRKKIEGIEKTPGQNNSPGQNENLDQKKEVPGQNNIPGTDSNDVLKQFYPFDEKPILHAYFNGVGKSHVINNVQVNTWSFTDLEGNNWLVPQWQTLSDPQPPFMGFSMEETRKYVYHLNYIEFRKMANGGTKHVIEIFRKLP